MSSPTVTGLRTGDVMTSDVLTVDADQGLLLTWELVCQSGASHPEMPPTGSTMPRPRHRSDLPTQPPAAALAGACRSGRSDRCSWPASHRHVPPTPGGGNTTGPLASGSADRSRPQRHRPKDPAAGSEIWGSPHPHTAAKTPISRRRCLLLPVPVG